MARILHLVDERAGDQSLTDVLVRAGHTCVDAGTLPDALHALRTGPIELIVADEATPGMSARELADLLHRGGFDTPLIMLVDYESDQLAATNAGTVGFVYKPVRLEHLSLAIDQALEFARMRRESESLRGEIAQLREEMKRGADGGSMAATLSVPQAAMNGDAPPSGIVLHTLNVDEVEKALIKRALELTNNNRTRTAALLGISVRTLRNKLNTKNRPPVRAEDNAQPELKPAAE
jgi:DNA-binding NtrC family response regulator